MKNQKSFSVGRFVYLLARQVMKRLVWCTILLLSINSAFAADGFREFKFGESLDSIQKTGRKLCRFGKVEKHTRWTWITRIDCTDYQFKGNVKARLFFEFSDDELVKVFAVSRNIQNYLLLRHSEYNYRLPLKSDLHKSSSSNLADVLLLKDKVHQLGDEYRYTTFYYQGKWEWEYLYEKKGNRDDQRRRKEDQLAEEEEGGVAGWDKFKFDESEEVIKDKLEGMCSKITAVSGDEVDTVSCDDFTFLGKKVSVSFLFDDAGLVKIELKLTSDRYAELLPLLKRKYGLPFLELYENNIYFPSIEFPMANVVLAYKRDNGEDENVWLTLKYMKQGYEDRDQTTIWQKLKSEPGRVPRSKLEKIMDSI